MVAYEEKEVKEMTHEPELCRKRGNYLAKAPPDAVFYRCNEVGFCKNQIDLRGITACKSKMPYAGLL